MIAKRITRTFIIFVTIIVLLAAAGAAFYIGLTYVLGQSARMLELEKRIAAGGGTLVTAETPGAIEIVVPRAADAKKIAEILAEKKIISNPTMFQVMSRFNGFDGMYVAGTHFVTASMNYDEIMVALSLKPSAVRVMFPEGLKYEDVKERLRKAGVRFNEAAMDALMRNPEPFIEYAFVQQLPKDPNRRWALEGYLYPDTYEFDRNADEQTIINTFLRNMDRHLPKEYLDRAAQNGMTIDQALTLASIIQSESSRIDEMITVSGVFHNRMARQMKFESCATINYLREIDGLPAKYWLSAQDINQYAASPYNTYVYSGMPPAPINSPGDDALRSALWPERNKWLFFAANGQGGNGFFETQEQQEAYAREMQASWNSRNQQGG